MDKMELTKAVCVTVGRGGHCVYFPCGKRVTGYETSVEQLTAKIAIELGIPVIDSTTIPDSKISHTVSFPILTINAEYVDKPPYGMLDAAPLEHIASMKQKLGATVYNLEVPEYDPSWLTVKKVQAKALNAFMSGNEADLFDAMCDWKK